jgi:uncharacterized caspase-like protein
MSKNWAIVIGINRYDHLQSLDYAGQDALRISAFLQQELEFNKIFLFTDDSPDIGKKSTRPTLTNLIKTLDEIFAQPCMGTGDSFWLFFSGHGILHQGRDYLMPADGYPSNVERTAIAVDDITAKLRDCGADNVVMILDACRKSSTRSGEGIGRQSAEAARQTGVITFFSCSHDQFSYEIADLQQGAFTYALLEGLSIRGKCATVERLDQYLSQRVPELVRQHKHDDQIPYTIVAPIAKSTLILNRRYATRADVDVLRIDAYKAEVIQQDYELAQQLWMRVIAAANGPDMDAIKAIQRIALHQAGMAAVASSSVTIANTADSTFMRENSSKWSKQLLQEINVGIANQASPEDSDEDLKSTCNVDYAKLRDFLKAKQWQEANQETERVMLKVAGCEKDGWLDSNAMDCFPVIDLRTIDRLWLKYTNSHFGFSIQKKIFNQVNQKEKNFLQTVNWNKASLKGGVFLKENHLNFSLDAPEGHLPMVFGGEHSWIFSAL